MTAIPSSNMVDLPVLSVLLVGGGVGVGAGSLGDVGDVAHEVAADDVPVVVLPGVRVSGPSQGRAPLGVARQLDEGGGRGLGVVEGHDDAAAGSLDEVGSERR